MILVPLTAGLICIAALLVSLPLLRRVAVDVPNLRSSHAAPVPRGGGVAVMVGLFSGGAVGYMLGNSLSIALACGIAVMALLGFIDDLNSRSARVRLGVTLIVALAVAMALVRPTGLVPWGIVVLSAVFMGGFANAFNFMDGVNGISSLNAMVAGSWLAFLSHRAGMTGGVVVGLAIGGACLGFLPFNAPRAHVFLGDSGSYGLGLAIAGLGLWVWQAGVPLYLVLVPMWIYIVDTFTTFAKRVAKGEHWSEPHREHVYQKVADLTGHMTSAAVTIAFSAALMLTGLVFIDHATVVVCGAILIAALYSYVPRLLLRKRRSACTSPGSTGYMGK